MWHLLHILPLHTHLEETKACQHKTSVGKTEDSHGYKRKPIILPQSRVPKSQPAPHLCTFHLLLHLRAPAGPACPDAAPAAAASLCEQPKVPLPGSVLVPHLHTAVAVLNELGEIPPPRVGKGIQSVSDVTGST